MTKAGTIPTGAIPPRVAGMLESSLRIVAEVLERPLAYAFDDFEQQLFKLAEQARNNQAQNACFESLREFKRGRSDIFPRVLVELEAELAAIGRNQSRGADVNLKQDSLTLLDEREADERVAIEELSSREEAHHALALYLLGQRFAVLAGSPAFDAEHVPLGPRSLIKATLASSRHIDLATEHRTVMLRHVDRALMPVLAAMLEQLNRGLVQGGVLPALTRLAPRMPRAIEVRDDGASESPIDAAPQGLAGSATVAQDGGGAHNDRPARAGIFHNDPRQREVLADVVARVAQQQALGRDASATIEAMAAPLPTRPVNHWPGESIPASPAKTLPAPDFFNVLKDLLGARQEMLGRFGQKSTPTQRAEHIVAPDQVEQALRQLQAKPAARLQTDQDGGEPRTVQHLREDLLAQMRRHVPAGSAPALSEHDGTTFDLVGMLFDSLGRDVRPNSPAAALLVQLQPLLLRIALSDPRFFSEPEHPARQLIDTVAESSGMWHDPAVENPLVGKAQAVVERVTREFDGDPALLAEVARELSTHLEMRARKSEIAERRHIEAARGRERLELSRNQAAAIIQGQLEDQNVPKLLSSMLESAWADVLSLAILRHGEGSEALQALTSLSRRLIDRGQLSTDPDDPVAVQRANGLADDVVKALIQVGYAEADGRSLARHLIGDEQPAGGASRTELVVGLKTRTRLGGDPAAASRHDVSAPLTPAETEHRESLVTLPFGTWFEFTLNQRGDRVRRRMAWFSSATGHTLFVTPSGQKAGDYSLDWLAREIHRGNVSVVTEEPGSLVDRAWRRVLRTLGPFARKTEPNMQVAGHG